MNCFMTIFASFMCLRTMVYSQKLNGKILKKALGKGGLDEFNKLNKKGRKNAFKDLVLNNVPLRDGKSLHFNIKTGKVRNSFRF